MLKVQSLTKIFHTDGRSFKALNGLSFEVAESQIYTLIGPNGAGKTTTIKILTGIYRKDKGSVTLFGKDLVKKRAKVLPKIGYIPDEPLFYPYLKGFEILDFVRVMYKVPKNVYKKRLKTLLKKYPIEYVLSQYPESYSRGNKQKLSIISALIHNPSLLVIDEPIVGLDPRSIETTANLLKKFASEGNLVLLSTHTLSFVEEIADKIGVIDKGKIIMEEKTKKVLNTKGGKKSLKSVFLSLIDKQNKQ